MDMTNGMPENPRQMQFSDYLVDLALRVSNDCLRTIRVMTPVVVLGAVEDLRIQIARIEACAKLYGKDFSCGKDCAKKPLRTIIRSCEELDLLLFVPTLTRNRVDTVEGLLKRVRKKKTHKALVRFSQALQPSPGPASVELDVDRCQELLVLQSDAWRKLPLQSVNQGQSASHGLSASHLQTSRILEAAESNKDTVERYQQSYRKGKKLGERVLHNGEPKQHVTWYQGVRRLRLQLEVMRAALGEENKATRWYLEKLQQNLAELIALDDFESFAAKLSEGGRPTLKQKDVLRLGSLCLSRRETLKRRSAKLYQGIYGQKVKVFGQFVANDLNQLNLDKIILLPKPGSNQQEKQNEESEDAL